jgi:hypothetical protein
VDLSRALAAELAVLTDALDDPDADLQSQVHRLGAVVGVSVSSFMGLRLTVLVDGYPFTITAMGRGAGGTGPGAVGASVLITLEPAGRWGPRSSVVFYAGTPGAFVDLAADAARQDPTPGAVVLDAHLDDPDGAHPVSGTSGWAEISVINQALGVVMGGGRTPAEARAVLDARAAGTGLGIVATAREVVAAAASRNPPLDPDDDLDMDDGLDTDDGLDDDLDDDDPDGGVTGPGPDLL